MFNAIQPKLGQTWVALDGEICGAQPDERGPIGGGAGYTNILVPTPDPVSTLDELLEALANAKPNDVEVHLSNGVELGPTTPTDLTPNRKMNVRLNAKGQVFIKWSAHAEVG